MFNGIITKLGKISYLSESTELNIAIEIQHTNSNNNPALDQSSWLSLKEGNSVACDGICLTVVKNEIYVDQEQADKINQIFWVQLSKATLDVSNAKLWQIGYVVNLERPIVIGEHLEGHFVLGHVDSTIKLLKKEQQKLKYIDGSNEISSHKLYFNIPEHLIRYIAKKGSITINGVALTVNEINLDEKWFTVNIIPYSYQSTNLQFLTIESGVANLEIDVIARYINKIAKQE